MAIKYHINSQVCLHLVKVVKNTCVYSIADVPSLEAESSYPTLQYSLYYDIQRNSLTVNLGQAFNLPARAKSGSGDTSIILYLQPNKAEVFESKVIRKDRNPIFDQTFEFTGLMGVQVARKQTLIFKVYGRSRYMYMYMILPYYNSYFSRLDTFVALPFAWLGCT